MVMNCVCSTRFSGQIFQFFLQIKEDYLRGFATTRWSHDCIHARVEKSAEKDFS